MIEYISREEAVKAISLYANPNIDGKAVLSHVSSADVRHNIHGHWEKTPKAVMSEGYMWYCNKCLYEVYQDSSRNYPDEKYCPNCGADMREPKGEKGTE